MRNGNILMHSKINLLHRRRCGTYLLGHSWGTLGALLGHSWGTLGQFWSRLRPILGRTGANLGHFWGTLGALLGHLGLIGRVLDGIRVYGNLDPVGVELFRDGRFGKVVLLPMPVEIGKARAGAFADVDECKDVENMRIARVAGSAFHGHGLVHSENARIGEADRLRLFLYDDAAASMVVGMNKRIRHCAGMFR